MLNESNFIVRTSGRKANSFYIDHAGVYKIDDIAKTGNLKASAIEEAYKKNGAVYDETLDVYYFSNSEDASKAISDITGKVKGEYKGRMVFLSEAEIELIRKALINENSNTIHIRNKLKDEIFKKLNG
ncbi:MAG: hypothetical protein HGA22_08705 [Clostridiales bacterium]|nr:hypothetical protein [Clostridiales bacterium]